MLAAQVCWHALLDGRATHADAATFVLDLVSSVFFTVIVNIRTALDLRGGELGRTEIFSWALGRLWAAVLLDFLVWPAIAMGIGLVLAGGVAGNTDWFFAGAFVVLLAAPLVFCDVAASIEPDERWSALLFGSIRRSLVLAYRGGTWRVFALVGLVAAQLMLQDVLTQLFTRYHLHDAPFWASGPLAVLTVPFFAALTTAIYFDAAAREQLARD